MICFLQFFFFFFFKNRSNNSFAFNITSNICPQHSIFNFCNDKNFFRPIINKIFRKNIFIFWYSNNITNFKFRIFIFNFSARVGFVLALDFTSTGFILIVLWYVLLTISSNLSIYTFFYWSHVFIIFVLQDFNKSFSNSRFSFTMDWINPYIIILEKWFYWSVVKFTMFIYTYLLWFSIRLF